jgi:hypothetical protein
MGVHGYLGRLEYHSLQPYSPQYHSPQPYSLQPYSLQQARLLDRAGTDSTTSQLKILLMHGMGVYGFLGRLQRHTLQHHRTSFSRWGYIYLGELRGLCIGMITNNGQFSCEYKRGLLRLVVPISASALLMCERWFEGSARRTRAVDTPAKGCPRASPLN